MSIDSESKWDEDLRTFLTANADLINEIPAVNFFVQGEPYGHMANSQFIIIRGQTYSFETQMSNRLEQDININILIFNVNWDNREAYLEGERIILLIAKVLLADITMSGRYKLIFNTADVVKDDIPDSTNYPGISAVMTFTGKRELESAIVPI